MHNRFVVIGTKRWEVMMGWISTQNVIRYEDVGIPHLLCSLSKVSYCRRVRLYLRLRKDNSNFQFPLLSTPVSDTLVMRWYLTSGPI